MSSADKVRWILIILAVALFLFSVGDGLYTAGYRAGLRFVEQIQQEEQSR